MEYHKKEKIKFVRVLIGNSETGNSGLKKPVKTINLKDTNVNEIYQVIKKSIDKEIKSAKK